MKNATKRALAILLALLLAAAMFALAEETDLEVQEEEVLLGEDLSEGPDEPDAPGEDATAGAVAYCFIVGDELYATQEALEGDEILPPEEPAAPEGMAFVGWALEDGAPLFTDADGDGEIDPVIAHVDPLVIEVNVIAVFVEVEDTTSDASLGLQPVSADAEPASPQGEALGTDEADPEDADPEPSPLGGRRPSEQSERQVAERSEADEVVPQNEPPADPEEEDTTSDASLGLQPVSADAEPASPEGEAIGTEDAVPQPSPDEEADEVASPSTEDGDAAPAPTPNALTYTSEAQELLSAQPGAYLYSLDGESYGEAIPTAVNAGEYTVYYIPASDPQAEPAALTVTVAKADVVFIAPEAATGEE